MFDVHDFIEDAQQEFGPLKTYQFAQQFMIRYLLAVEKPLPAVVRESIDIAERFLAGIVASREMERARVNCWSFLDAKGASVDFTRPETCVVRAAICFLYAEPPDDDVAQLVDWFLDLTNKLQDQSALVEKLVRNCFVRKKK